MVETKEAEHARDNEKEAEKRRTARDEYDDDVSSDEYSSDSDSQYSDDDDYYEYQPARSSPVPSILTVAFVIAMLAVLYKFKDTALAAWDVIYATSKWLGTTLFDAYMNIDANMRMYVTVAVLGVIGFVSYDYFVASAK